MSGDAKGPESRRPPAGGAGLDPPHVACCFIGTICSLVLWFSKSKTHPSPLKQPVMRRPGMTRQGRRARGTAVRDQAGNRAAADRAPVEAGCAPAMRAHRCRLRRGTVRLVCLSCVTQHIPGVVRGGVRLAAGAWWRCRAAAAAQNSRPPEFSGIGACAHILFMTTYLATAACLVDCAAGLVTPGHCGSFCSAVR